MKRPLLIMLAVALRARAVLIPPVAYGAFHVMHA